MRIISIRSQSDYEVQATQYIHGKWGDASNHAVYAASMASCIAAAGRTPYWYLLEHQGQLIGCAGLIDQDFLDRDDLSPWLCSLYVDPAYRGQGCGALLIAQVRQDAACEGFSRLYLCTDKTGYYEQYGFTFLFLSCFLDGSPARIYVAEL